MPKFYTEGNMLDMNWPQDAKELVKFNTLSFKNWNISGWQKRVTQKVFNTASGSWQYSLVKLIVLDMTFQYSELIRL